MLTSGELPLLALDKILFHCFLGLIIHHLVEEQLVFSPEVRGAKVNDKRLSALAYSKGTGISLWLDDYLE